MGEWTLKRLGDLLDYEQPGPYIVSGAIQESGAVPVLTAGKTFILGYTNELNGRYSGTPAIIFDDFTTATQWIDEPFKVKSSACKILTAREGVANLRFMASVLRSLQQSPQDHKRHWISVFADIEVVVPSYREQCLIAEIFEDIYSHVAQLNTLIAKKRDVRTAVTQQLLSGRARLPGFAGEWAFSSISDVSTRTSGYWGRDAHFDGAVLSHVIRAGDITPDGKLVSSAERYLSAAEYAKCAVLKGDVVITASGNGLGKTWLCDGRPLMTASNFVRRIRVDGSKVDSAFLAHSILSQRGRQMLDAHTATSAYPNLMPSFFDEPWIEFPPLDEQRAIAEMLTDMEAEIDALETQRDKAEMIKQGMMSDLLSGKVRLV